MVTNASTMRFLCFWRLSMIHRSCLPQKGPTYQRSIVIKGKRILCKVQRAGLGADRSVRSEVVANNLGRFQKWACHVGVPLRSDGLGAILGPRGSILARSEAVLTRGRSWARLKVSTSRGGSFRNNLFLTTCVSGTSWNQLGPSMGHLGAI